MQAFIPGPVQKKKVILWIRGIIIIIVDSAMVVRFLTGRFIWEYSAEERLYVHHCYIGDDDPDVLLEILDTEAKVGSV